ncbi:MAG: hypothetical protein PHN92_02130 [Geobacter sp.]|nr:hypothetical protein [Geobacter sp.]
MNTIRTEPLTKEEKAELTDLLLKLRILPQQGQVVLHCNNGRVAKVEPHIVLSVADDGGRKDAVQRLQQYKESARKCQAAGDKEKAGWYLKWAANLEKVLAEEK